MDIALDSLIKLYLFSSGRRLFALRKVRALAVAQNRAELVARIDQAMAHDQLTRELDSRWAGRTRLTQRINAQANLMAELDPLLDNAITALRDAAMIQTRAARPADPIHGEVQLFLDEVLPGGVFAITSLPYVDELAAVDVMVAKLQGPLAAAVTRLGLGRQVERLVALVAEYRAALEQEGLVPVEFAAVRAARDQGQQYLLEIVGMIVGMYCQATDPAQRAACAALLVPILEQNEAVRAYLRARRPVRDVDPDTGEPSTTEPDATDPTDPTDPIVPGSPEPGSPASAKVTTANRA